MLVPPLEVSQTILLHYNHGPELRSAEIRSRQFIGDVQEETE